MSKNPFVNALAGLLYIVAVVSILFYSASFQGSDTPNIFIPVGVLSLFVFSAATMSYIFLYQPLQFFLEGKKKEAVDLFLKTLAAFGVSALMLFVLGLHFQTHIW